MLTLHAGSTLRTHEQRPGTGPTWRVLSTFWAGEHVHRVILHRDATQILHIAIRSPVPRPASAFPVGVFQVRSVDKGIDELG